MCVRNSQNGQYPKVPLLALNQGPDETSGTHSNYLHKNSEYNLEIK